MLYVKRRLVKREDSSVIFNSDSFFLNLVGQNKMKIAAKVN